MPEPATALWPARLDDFCLPAAIEWRLCEFQARSHIRFWLTNNVAETRLPFEQSSAAAAEVVSASS